MKKCLENLFFFTLPIAEKLNQSFEIQWPSKPQENKPLDVRFEDATNDGTDDATVLPLKAKVSICKERKNV